MSTSEFNTVAVLPELDAEVLSPSPILKNFTEFTSDAPVPRSLTVDPDKSASNDSCELLPVLTIPAVPTKADVSLCTKLTCCVASSLFISSLVSCPAIIGLYPLMPLATSPSAIPGNS